MYFSAKSFLQNTNGVNQSMSRIYPYKALIPVMDWLPSQRPAAPALRSARGNAHDGILLEWKDTVSTSSAACYVIYRFAKDEPLNLEDATRILAVLPRTPYSLQSWTDRQARKRSTYTYLVTGVGRLHHESAGSAPLTVRVRR